MAKAKTAYVCGQCGAEHTKWQGQCEACGVWNSLTEFVIAPASPVPTTSRRSGYSGASAPPRIVGLTEVAASEEVRPRIGIGELDRVLGGGLVDGSVVLVGGDPGIGKSTLLLQTLGAIGARMKSLYVSGEESLAQIASRAQRLGLPLEPLRCLAETCVERVVENAQKDAPRVLVIDSIQTIWTELLTAAPGSVSQVRESAARLVRFANETGTSIFLVGHVTKEGGIAGPRVLEHMVDAVLYFEGEPGSRFRLLRAFKNRFGAVNELGVFAMSDKGLREVPNPSAIFLSSHGAPTPEAPYGHA
jgi:DNA repair protein RadA/Sms